MPITHIRHIDPPMRRRVNESAAEFAPVVMLLVGALVAYLLHENTTILDKIMPNDPDSKNESMTFRRTRVLEFQDSFGDRMLRDITDPIVSEKIMAPPSPEVKALVNQIVTVIKQKWPLIADRYSAAIRQDTGMLVMVPRDDPDNMPGINTQGIVSIIVAFMRYYPKAPIKDIMLGLVYVMHATNTGGASNGMSVSTVSRLIDQVLDVVPEFKNINLKPLGRK